MQKLRKFMVNGIILSVTSLFLRSIGVGFGAFVSRILGADGMGLFTLIMSVYGLAVTAAAAGINLASTRMCAEALGRGDISALNASLKKCLVYSVVCGSLACTLLFSGAEYVASVWLSDIRCAPSLRLLALSLPFIAASNVLHGYFTAMRKASKSAAVQIFEQLFKFFITAFALLYIVPDGIEYACMAIVGGGALAEIASFLMALILYLADRQKRKSGSVSKKDSKKLTRELFGITLPVAGAALIRSALTTVEHILIPRGLEKNPLTANTAMAAYGVLCGMVIPVIMFPTALLYSFTGLLVPEFAQSDAEGDTPRLRSMVTRSLRLTLVFSVGCAYVMTVFSNELGMLIYANNEAGRFIGIMAPLIPVMYLDHAVDAMLKGLGEQLYCMKINIADAALCTFLVWFLCPRIGIYGYIVTLYAAELMNASLSIHKLYKTCPFEINIPKALINPIICAVGAFALLRILGMFSLPCTWVALIAGGVVSVGIYILLLVLTGVVSLCDIGYRKKQKTMPR